MPNQISETTGTDEPMFLLHAGLPKSGSSTLQTEMNRLSINRPAQFAYHSLTLEALEKLEAGDRQVEQDISRIIAESHRKGVTCLMSHEALIHKPDALQRVLTTSAEHYPRRELVFLLREPAAATLSAYSQWGFRGQAAGAALNDLLDELDLRDRAMLLTARELFCMLQLQRIESGQRPVFPLFSTANRIINEFEEQDRLGVSRISAISLNDAPRNRSLLGHCWDLLGSGSTVTGLRSEALQVNKSFHPLCIELVTRDPATGRFLEFPRYTPHDNRPVREISAILEAESRTRIPVIDDRFERELLGDLATAFTPLLQPLSVSVMRGAWDRYFEAGQGGTAPNFINVIQRARQVAEQRSGSTETKRRRQLAHAERLISGYRFKPAALRTWFRRI